jgi:TPR repeat protein
MHSSLRRTNHLTLHSRQPLWLPLLLTPLSEELYSANAGSPRITLRPFHRLRDHRVVRRKGCEARQAERLVVSGRVINQSSSATIQQQQRQLYATKQYFFSTSCSPSNEDADADTNEGAKLYRRYLELQDQVKEIEKEAERVKSEKMYEAWKKAAEPSSSSSNGVSNEDSKTTIIATGNNKGKTNSDRMAGVAVIRTLARESKRPDTVTRVQELRRQAAHLLASAADDTHQYPPALVRMGNDVLEQDPTRAMQYYRNAGQRGSAEGWLHLGHCLWERSSTGSGGAANTDHTDSITESALDAFWNAAKLGDHDAKYFLGVHLLGDEDKATDKDSLRKGLDLIQSAATAGHGSALHYLVLINRNGNNALGIQPCGQQEFMERLDRAVQHDADGESHFLRGSCLLAGDVYEKSPRRALEDFLMASDLGQSDAAISAGALLHHGVPDQIPQNRRKAFELYQHAGELGNLEGWRNVVSCYLQGHGIPQSTSIAKYIAETMLRPKTI